MIFNPILTGGKKLPVLTNPGTAADLLAGKQLIDQNGEAITGTIATKTATDLTASGSSIIVPAGYYDSEASKSVATATQATPSISVSSSGLITASSTQTAGYVSAGTKSATRQLTTQAGKTVTPSTSTQTAVSSGRYTTGTVYVAGDTNLRSYNIASGVSIFGVTGTAEIMQSRYHGFYTRSTPTGTRLDAFPVSISGIESADDLYACNLDLFFYYGLSLRSGSVQYIHIEKAYDSYELEGQIFYLITREEADTLPDVDWWSVDMYDCSRDGTMGTCSYDSVNSEVVFDLSDVLYDLGRLEIEDLNSSYVMGVWW